MKKEGYFALYQEKEFEVEYDASEDKMYLYSKNPSDLSLGFVEIRKGLFIKGVLPSDIQSAYEIKTYAEYKGHRFRVVSIMNGKVHLSYSGSKPSIASRLGFTFIEPYVLEKLVSAEEVTRIWQETVPLWDYPLPQENGI